MADVSGLRLLPPDQLAARDASSYGTGEVVGFKCFLLHSGVDEFPPLDPEGLELALKEIASFGAMMIVHAEDANAIDRAASPRGDNYADFLSSRPRGAENLAIAESSNWRGGRVAGCISCIYPAPTHFR